MGIEDIQISEELETNAPSIKYSGNEGPKSPQDEQRMKMAQLEEAYSQYVEEMIEQGIEPMSLQQFIEQAMAEGQMSGGQPLPQDPTKPVNPFGPKPTGPVLPDRQMAARGGIMGADGRTRFLFGGIKKRIRKLIPNEIAEVAEKAAPFVAPFNPLAAGIASAVGSFDRTGKVGSSLMSGLKNYGIGQLTRGIGGGMDNLQRGFNPLNTKNFGSATQMGSGIGKYFSSPIQNTGGLGAKILSKPTQQVTFDASGMTSSGGEGINSLAAQAHEVPLTDAAITKLNSASMTKPKLFETVLSEAKEFIPKSFAGINPLSKSFSGKQFMGTLFGVEMAKKLFGEGATPDNITSEILNRGGPMKSSKEIIDIRTRVQSAFKDPTGKQLEALRIEFPFLGNASDKI